MNSRSGKDRQTFAGLNPTELINYSFIVIEAKCRVSCNTITDLHAE